MSRVKIIAKALPFFFLILISEMGFARQALKFSGQGYFSVQDSLPSDFPKITVSVNNNPSEGYIYLSNFILEAGVKNTPYLIILTKEGTPFFYRKMSSALNLDFKPQPNGIYTYFDYQKGKFYGMNSNFEITDSFYCGNGSPTDEHELRILPNGNYLLLGNDIRFIDMRRIVQRGNPNAKVIGFIIQEVDPSGNVVFHWSTFDHFNITDATEDIDLTKQVVDYAHCNALEIADDGNILLSVRYFDEITKIDRQTGDIIWRMGGSKCKNNEFTFLNDTDSTGFTGFSHQHAVRLLPNGHLTLFDNGNLKKVKKSRAVEYEIDETNKTVKKVWSFTHPDSVYTSAMGYVQRLSNGNTLIGWGQNHNGKTVTEVTPDGQIVFDLSLPDKVYSYRVYKAGLITSVASSEKIPEPVFKLFQNYPNPFGADPSGNPTTTISYVVPSVETRHALSLQLIVCDVLGRKVATLVNKAQAPGNYSVQFNAQDLPSGIYFYTLKAGNFVKTRKMILLK